MLCNQSIDFQLNYIAAYILYNLPSNTHINKERYNQHDSRELQLGVREGRQAQARQRGHHGRQTQR